MNIDTDTLAPTGLPVFLKETEQLVEWMRRLSYAEAKALWKCNDRIAEQNYRRFQEMDLTRNLTPAVTAYEGIQYQYMAPAVFGAAESEYIQEHLRILSGFYGVLKPFDGVVPYRLEMQAKASDAGDLYRFWGGKLYREAVRGDKGNPPCRRTEKEDWRKGAVIVNLASKEYSRCIEKYLQPEDAFITVTFGELADGKVRQKGTYAKMAQQAGLPFRRRAVNGERIRIFETGGIEYGMSGKCAVVSLRRTGQWIELVSCRLSLVHYDRRDTCGDAVL